jgi:hypothetical protein
LQLKFNPEPSLHEQSSRPKRDTPHESIKQGHCKSGIAVRTIDQSPRSSSVDLSSAKRLTCLLADAAISPARYGAQNCFAKVQGEIDR